MKQLMLVIVLAMLPIATALAGTPPQHDPLHNGMIKVAFAISKHVNVMDIAGPWEVFADTSLKDANGKDVSPYELYTVAASQAPLHSEGANHPGLTITPDYDFTHAPTPDIVVVPAQMGGAKLQAWLKKIHAQHATIMSVCTGAFQLAHAGLLNGKQATTHHWYFGDFSREFPDVKLVKDVRYVQADPITFTAGGLTSGVDLALHMVSDRFGQNVAQQTANFMEYLGTGWKTNRGIPALDLPIQRTDWTGQFDGGTFVLHEVTYGASPIFTVDIPGKNVQGAPAMLAGKGKQARLTIAMPGHTAVVSGKMNAAGTAVSGTFVLDGKSYPLTLTRGRAVEGHAPRPRPHEKFR
ncbi:MAG: GlxA family transcriptional regulator [Rhodanobacteraceae bacterium]